MILDILYCTIMYGIHTHMYPHLKSKPVHVHVPVPVPFFSSSFLLSFFFKNQISIAQYTSYTQPLDMVKINFLFYFLYFVDLILILLGYLSIWTTFEVHWTPLTPHTCSCYFSIRYRQLENILSQNIVTKTS